MWGYMDNKKDEINFHASSTGRLYIKENEFFKTTKVKKQIEKLLESSIYKDIKARTSQPL
jgi:hypothetical protein